MQWLIIQRGYIISGLSILLGFMSILLSTFSIEIRIAIMLLGALSIGFQRQSEQTTERAIDAAQQRADQAFSETPSGRSWGALHHNEPVGGTHGFPPTKKEE